MEALDLKFKSPVGAFQFGWLDALDRRTAIAQSILRRHEAICNDLGGRDQLTYIQLSLIERSLWLETWIASEEQKIANGGECDIAKLTTANNALRRNFERLGFKRLAKPTKSLQEVITRGRG